MPISISLPAFMPASEAIKLLNSLKGFLELKASVKPSARLNSFTDESGFMSRLERQGAIYILQQTYERHKFKSVHDTCFETCFHDWWYCPATSIQEAIHVIGETIKELQNNDEVRL